MKIVTIKQAIRKATSIWGKNAIVDDNGKPHILPNGAQIRGQYAVGKNLAGFFYVEGDGDSWDAAFANYEDRLEREKMRLKTLLQNKI